MSKLDEIYKSVIQTIIDKGVTAHNRTGIDTLSYSGVMIRHDMSDGFPLITLRRIPYKSAFAEMEGFIKGITNKRWYIEHNCHFWDQWCSPIEFNRSNPYPDVKYGDRRAFDVMKSIEDLGPIYGFQWRCFNGVDQLKNIVYDLKNNPTSRRMVCSAWNPKDLHQMALPSCHFTWQVTVTNNKLNLFFNQRSCDFILGNNLVGYGLLLKLMALESGYEEGILVAMYNDCHLYENHMYGIKELLSRESNYDLPKLTIQNFKSIFDWKCTDYVLENYNYIEPQIKFPVAI